MHQENQFQNKMIKYKTKNKNAQEEIVGFVLIIVLVSIVFMILLGIMIRNSSKDIRYDSKEYSQLLSSMMEHTSDCVIYSPARAKVSDLIGYCIDNMKCSSGISACDSMNSTISGILSKAIRYGPENSLKGYSLSITYDNNSSRKNEKIFILKKGVCNSSITGADNLLYNNFGNIITEIRVCY